MILHGDELGRSQGGNNNTYAQDSEISWVHWDRADEPLIEFTAAVSRLRKDHPTFRRSRFFNGRPVEDAENAPLPDIVWFKTDGSQMAPKDWDSGFGKSVGMFLNGNGIRQRDSRGETMTDVDFLVIFNAHDGDVDFTIPTQGDHRSWDVVIDTAGKTADSEPQGLGRDDRRRAHVAPRAPRAQGRPARAGSLGRRIARGAEQLERDEQLDHHDQREPDRGVGPPGPLMVEKSAGRTPISTYRLQIRSSFTLQDAASITDYLHDLGVDWVYLSPLLKAESGSDHGYDVVDHSQIDPDRGGACRPRRRVGCGPQPRHGRAHRHRAEPRGRRHACGHRMVVGRAEARTGVAATPRRSTSTGTSQTASSACPTSAPPTTCPS